MGTIIIVVIAILFAVAVFLVAQHTLTPRPDIDSQSLKPASGCEVPASNQPTAAPTTPEICDQTARIESEASKPPIGAQPPPGNRPFAPYLTGLPSRFEGQKNEKVDLSLVPKEFVVLDLETTGLSPENHEIIEIGAIRVNRDSETHPSFQSLVKPKERVPRIITEMTGITQVMVDRDGLPISEALVRFKEFIGDLPLVTFNATFDMGFLWNAANKHCFQINNRYTCALKLARRAYPGLPSYRLVDLARMGNLSDCDTHRALGDCMRTVPIFIASVSKIGERVRWDVPNVDWRVSVQYHALRDANRAFLAQTRAVEAADPELAVTRYREAMVRMYEYEKLIFNFHGDDHIIDRLTLALAKLGRYDELVDCVDEFMERFPEAQSSIMTSVLRRKEKAASKVLAPAELSAQ